MCGILGILNKNKIKIIAEELQAKEKVQLLKNNSLVKLPLRKLAREIGLPKEIHARIKMPMLHGSTKETNTENASGFLEKTCKETYKKTLTALVEEKYLHYYANKNKVDLLTGSKKFTLREKELNL